MRILLIGEYSNVHWTLAEGLRSLGHKVCVVSNGDFWKNYRRNISLVRREGKIGGILYLLKTYLTLPLLRNYDVVQIINPMFLEVKAERIGERPCSGDVDPVRYQALMERAGESLRDVIGVEPHFRSGSTDCNIPLSRGIPAVCISVVTGAGCHTRSEWLELDSLPKGCRFFMDLLAKYYEL